MVDVKQQITQTREQLAQARSQLQSAQAPNLTQAQLRSGKLSGLQSLPYRRAVSQYEKAVSGKMKEVAAASATFEQQVAEVAPEYGQEQLVEVEYKKAVDTIQKNISLEETKIGEREAKIKDIYASNKPDYNRIDRLRDEITVRRAKILGFQEALQGGKGDVIKNVSSGKAFDLANTYAQNESVGLYSANLKAMQKELQALEKPMTITVESGMRPTTGVVVKDYTTGAYSKTFYEGDKPIRVESYNAPVTKTLEIPKMTLLSMSPLQAATAIATQPFMEVKGQTFLPYQTRGTYSPTSQPIPYSKSVSLLGLGGEALDIASVPFVAAKDISVGVVGKGTEILFTKAREGGEAYSKTIGGQRYSQMIAENIPKFSVGAIKVISKEYGKLPNGVKSIATPLLIDMGKGISSKPLTSYTPTETAGVIKEAVGFGYYALPVVGTGAFIGETWNVLKTPTPTMEQLKVEIPEGATPEDITKIEEYNKGIPDIIKSYDNQKLIAASSLLLGGAIMGVGKAVEKKAATAYGLKINELKTLTNLQSGQKFNTEYYALRSKALRFLEKKGDTTKISRFNEVYSSTTSIPVSKLSLLAKEEVPQNLKMPEPRVDVFPFTTKEIAMRESQTKEYTSILGKIQDREALFTMVGVPIKEAALFGGKQPVVSFGPSRFVTQEESMKILKVAQQQPDFVVTFGKSPKVTKGLVVKAREVTIQRPALKDIRLNEFGEPIVVETLGTPEKLVKLKTVEIGRYVGKDKKQFEAGISYVVSPYTGKLISRRGSIITGGKTKEILLIDKQRASKRSIKLTPTKTFFGDIPTPSIVMELLPAPKIVARQFAKSGKQKVDVIMETPQAKLFERTYSTSYFAAPPFKPIRAPPILIKAILNKPFKVTTNAPKLLLGSEKTAERIGTVEAKLYAPIGDGAIAEYEKGLTKIEGLSISKYRAPKEVIRKEEVIKPKRKITSLYDVEIKKLEAKEAALNKQSQNKGLLIIQEEVPEVVLKTKTEVSNRFVPKIPRGPRIVTGEPSIDISEFIGKGTYERTAGTAMQLGGAYIISKGEKGVPSLLLPKPSMKITLQESIKPLETQTSFSMTGNVISDVTEIKPIEMIKTSSINKSVEVLKPVEMLKQEPQVKVDVIQNLKVETLPRIQEITATKVTPKPLQIPKIKVETIAKPQARVIPKPVVSSFRPREPITPKIPKKIKISLPEEDFIKKKTKVIKGKPKGYEVLVRRRGKFIPISQYAYSKEEAYALGSRRVLKTAAATFRITPSEKPILVTGTRPSPESLTKFRPPKAGTPLTYVQRRSTRIGSAGEVQEISLRGAAARRKPQGIFSKLFNMKGGKNR